MRVAAVMLVLVALASEVHAAPVTVGVDLSKLDGVPPADISAIEQALVARLVQDGFAVVPLTGEPTIVLTITVHEGALAVAAKTERFDRSRSVDGGGAGAQLELVQKAVELARLAAESIPPPPRKDVELPAPLVSATPAVPREPPRWAVGVDAGVLVRGGGTDVELVVGGRFTIWRQLGATLVASGSRSSENAVDVRELQALIGPSYAWTFRDQFALEIALVAGVRSHHFETEMALAEPTGDRLDVTVAAPLRVGWRPLRALELSVWTLARVAAAREHVLGTRVLWHRDAIGIGAGVGVAARF